jgi:hypothetical protein
VITAAHPSPGNAVLRVAASGPVDLSGHLIRVAVVKPRGAASGHSHAVRTGTMKSQKIKPGTYYWANSPYGEGTIQVLVVERSEAVEDHWVCRRLTGKRILLPSLAILRPVRKGE